MIQHHNWSLSELENMIPWERDVYTRLLITHIEHENQKQRDQDAKMKSKR
tara:strand:+ start:2057 stop:2206 length:150 start_codon:yes stop_codon:yes gene_type:complete